ncbi:MAG: hypothetical protein IT442_16675 [Phycisphaeraceae bacterium]|nr:hypothetical protein [Phycisphaeraceae bacterium]
MAVLAWMVDERLVGVMVLAVAEVKAGKVLDVVAIRFTPGSWTRKIDDFLAAMCRAGGCIGYRGYSPRPVNRLLDLEPLDAGWFRRVEHAQQ